MVTAIEQPSVLETLRDPGRLLTAQDLAMLPDDGNRYELIGGRLYVSPSPTYVHQRVSMQLGTELSISLKATNQGEVLAAPMDVHLSANDVVQPDLLVVLRENTDRIQARGVVGPPDLVVEIVSPTSARNDYLLKTKLYERSGIPEYWIVDPIEETVSVQRLHDRQYVLDETLVRGDILRSSVLDGFELDLSLIFPETPPVSDQPTEETQPTNDNA